MTLNDSQRNLILQKLKEVWTGDRPCPICSKVTSWGVSNISEMKEYNDGNYCHGAAVCPLIRVTCNRCGSRSSIICSQRGCVSRRCDERVLVVRPARRR